MLLPRESSQTQRQLRMKISKIKVYKAFFTAFGLQPSNSDFFHNLSICHLSLIDVLLLIKKRPPPTLPKMVDVGSEEKVGTVCYWLIWEQTKIILHYLYFFFITFIGIDAVVCCLCHFVGISAEEARKQGTRQRCDSESNCQPDNSPHGPHCNAAQHPRCKIFKNWVYSVWILL